MIRRVVLVRTDVSEECFVSSIIKVIRICDSFLRNVGFYKNHTA
jgi:hypothetical protein